MSYTQVFGGTTIYPSDVSLLAITLNADKALEWPLESNDPSNPAARIIDVTTTGSYAITLPDATQTGAGQTILFNNLSASTNSFLVKNAGGATIATVGIGEQWQVYLSDTSTVAGTWRVFRYGASTATVQASALRGDGLVVSGNTLAQSMPVITFSSGPRAVLLSDRASALVWNAGSAGVLNLPTAASAGNNFFIGVRNSGGGDLTVNASGSELVDGLPSLALRPGDSTNFITDGLQWYTLGLGQQAVFAFDYTIIGGLTGGSYTLAGSELNRIAYRFESSGALSADQDIVVPATVQQYWVENATTGTFNLYLRTSGGTRVAVTQGGTGIFYCNGTDVVDADTSTISLPISAAQGGTGLTSYNAGDMLYANGPTSLTKLSAVVAGNALLSGGTGAAPAWGKIGLTTHVTGTLPVANGGTGATTSTGTGAVVLATSPTLVTPNLGTPSAATLTNATGLPIIAGTTGTLSVARGGTGATSLTAGYLVKGNGTSAVSASVVYDDGANVGIGTPTPGGLLQLNKATGAADLRLSVGGTLYGNIYASASDLDIFAVTAIPIIFGTNNTERMRIDSAGNVIIGSTSGAFKLDVPTNAVHFLETLVGSDALGWARLVTAAGATFIQAGSLNSGSAVAQPIVFGNMYGAGIERLRILATGGITSPDLADAVGYKGMPQNSQTTSYTLAMSDMAKMIYLSGSTAGQSVTIPPNSGGGSVAFPVGTVIRIVNDSTQNWTIPITADTLLWSPTGGTGMRTLASRGAATLEKMTATRWWITGVGLT